MIHRSKIVKALAAAAFAATLGLAIGSVRAATVTIVADTGIPSLNQTVLPQNLDTATMI